MLGEADSASFSGEQADTAAEQLRFIQRLRDRLGLRAARIAADLARVEYGETMDSISTLDWIRHECKMGFQAAADLVCVGQEMDSPGASVAAVEDSEIGFQHLVFVARTKRAVGERPEQPAAPLQPASYAGA